MCFIGVVSNNTDPESLGNEEDNFVPSFQNSFSDALLSASNSVHLTSQSKINQFLYLQVLHVLVYTCI